MEETVTAVWLAEQSEGFSGAQIAGVCRRAVMATIAARIAAAAKEAISQDLLISRDAMQAALDEMRGHA